MSLSALKRIRLPALFAIGLGVVDMGEGQALESRTFLVSASAGYGVEECLDDGGECGRMVADAWCNAHGQGVALEFGRSEVSANGAWPAPKRYYVDCSANEPR